MKNKIVKYLFFIFVIGSSCSPDDTFNSAVLPNHCKKCIVKSPFDEQVWSEEGCGGEMTDIEGDAKVYAYMSGCGFTVSCSEWKKDETQ